MASISLVENFSQYSGTHFSLIKSVVFGFLVSSVPAYFGYYVKGGSLEVGKASTTAVVNTNILILFFDLILTRLLLT